MNPLSKYYQILGLKDKATEKEIKQAYRFLAKKWHPDNYVNEPEKEKIASEKFKEIANAYEILISGGENLDTSEYQQNSSGIKVKKTDPKTYFDLGNLALEDEDFTQAVEYFTIAIKINPEYREAYICRANALEKQGFQIRADNDWRKAKELKLEENIAKKTTYKREDNFDDNAHKTATKNKEEKVETNSAKEKQKVNIKQENLNINNQSQSSKTEVKTKEIKEILWKVKYTLAGHKNPINAIAISNNQEILVSGDNQGKLNIWDWQKKKIRYSLQAHKKAINSVAISNDNQLLATAGDDKNIRIWNLQTRLLVATIGGLFSGHKDRVLSVTFTPDSQFIISSSSDKSVRIWDINTKKELFNYSTYSDEILNIKVNKTGQYLATAGKERWIKILDLKTKKLAKSLKTNHIVTAIAFSPDSKILASGGFDRTIKLWDWQNKMVFATLLGHSEMISDLAFLPKENYLVSSSWDGNVKIWDLDNQQCFATFKTHFKEINCLTVSEDEKSIIAGGKDGVIKVINK